MRRAKGYGPLATWLIEVKADVHARNNAESTPLHAAAQNNSQQVAELLLRAGASGALKDGEGNSARDVAVERGHSQLARAIEASGQLTSVVYSKLAVVVVSVGLAAVYVVFG